MRIGVLAVLTLGIIAVTWSCARGLKDGNAWPWDISSRLTSVPTGDGWAEWAHDAGWWLVAPIAFACAYVLWGLFSAAFGHWRPVPRLVAWGAYPIVVCALIPIIAVIGEWVVERHRPVSLRAEFTEFADLLPRVGLLLLLGLPCTAIGMFGAALAARSNTASQKRRFIARLRRARRRKHTWPSP